MKKKKKQKRDKHVSLFPLPSFSPSLLLLRIRRLCVPSLTPSSYSLSSWFGGDQKVRRRKGEEEEVEEELDVGI